MLNVRGLLKYFEFIFFFKSFFLRSSYHIGFFSFKLDFCNSYLLILLITISRFESVTFELEAVAVVVATSRLHIKGDQKAAMCCGSGDC